MKFLFSLILIGVIAYFGWQYFVLEKNEALYEEPYVLVYGRDSCGWTRKYLNDLKAEEIEPIYEIVDEQEVSNELHTRMEKAGLSTRRYGLPVIDVNGQLFIRPDLDTILTIYNM